MADNKYITLYGRAKYFVGLIVTTILSIFLAASRNTRYGSDFAEFVQYNRASVQLVVQVLSQGLALIQLLALRSLYDFRIRLLLPRRYLSLNDLAFRTAISRQHFDGTLSGLRSALILLLLAISAVPGAMWAGSITPQITDDFQEPDGRIQVPSYSKANTSAWGTEFQVLGEGDELWNFFSPCESINDKRGFISSCPVPSLQGLLLTSASTATTNDPSLPRVHPRLDNARWSYIGRSYGVGSAPGLTELENDNDDTIISYSYLEAGYNTSVNCFKNASSKLSFSLDETVDEYHLGIYELQGSLPNVPPEAEGESVLSTQWTEDAGYQGLLAWAARTSNGRNYIGIATGSNNYTNFNQTQCEVDFIPMMFQVNVNRTASNITVVPQPSLPALNPDPSGRLIFNAIASIEFLSRISNSLYISTRGEALRINLQNTQQRLSDDSEATTLQSVADSFTAMLDDILVAYGASQIVLANSTESAVMTAFGPGVRLGEDLYIFLTLAFNVIAVVLVIFEAVRTRFWRGLLEFDPANIKCAMMAASAGGKTMAEHINDQIKSKAADDNAYWQGDPGCEAFDQVKVKYCTTPTSDCEHSYLVNSVEEVDNTQDVASKNPSLLSFWSDSTVPATYHLLSRTVRKNV